MEIHEIESSLEAILFASGEPVEVTRMAEELEIENEEATAILKDLGNELDRRKSGICLLKLGNKYQLCSRVEYAVQVRGVLEKKKNAQ